MPTIFRKIVRMLKAVFQDPPKKSRRIVKNKGRRRTKPLKKPVRKTARGSAPQKKVGSSPRPAAAASRGGRGRFVPKSTKKPVAKSSKVQKIKLVAVKNVKSHESPVKGLKIGEITHFFDKISVAVIRLNQKSLMIGDRIHIKGRHTDFKQKVNSMQIESVDVKVAKKGQLLGLKVAKPAQVGDGVYIQE